MRKSVPASPQPDSATEDGNDTLDTTYVRRPAHDAFSLASILGLDLDKRVTTPTPLPPPAPPVPEQHYVSVLPGNFSMRADVRKSYGAGYPLQVHALGHLGRAAASAEGGNGEMRKEGGLVAGHQGRWSPGDREVKERDWKCEGMAKDVEMGIDEVRDDIVAVVGEYEHYRDILKRILSPKTYALLPRAFHTFFRRSVRSFLLSELGFEDFRSRCVIASHTRGSSRCTFVVPTDILVEYTLFVMDEVEGILADPGCIVEGDDKHEIGGEWVDAIKREIEEMSG
ncbi:hypothetical protein HDU67_000975 [Dinochytrium kinnereticum]|nr:hypothetical protein HDU67_000975 [Dinochytrium kinnereticum]